MDGRKTEDNVEPEDRTKPTYLASWHGGQGNLRGSPLCLGPGTTPVASE